MPTTTYEYYDKPRAEILHMLGQRIRLHIVNCERHPDKVIIEFFEGTTAFNLDFINEHPIQFYRELKSSKYIPYSCVLILINCECKCRTQILRKILKNIRRNRHLRYKSKLIFSAYYLKEYYRSQKDVCVTGLVLEKYSSTIGSYMHPPLSEQFNELPPSTDVTENDRNFLIDHIIFNKSNVENTLFMQMFVREHQDRAYAVDAMLYKVDMKPLISMNELFFAQHTFTNDFIVEASTNVDFYFYTINPALAIIINNYYFTNDTGVRQGSEQDVRRLIRELKVGRIPFILLQDCSRNEILQIIEFVEKKNFSPLKSFLFFLMSHGHSDNIIDTHDGQLDLKKDIVSRIQENVTLKEAEILVVANACRGKIDAAYDDDDDIPIIETDSEYLRHNTVVMYSVPESLTSPRHPTHGSPYVKRFCQHFRNMSHGDDIRSVKTGIDKELVNTDDYYCYLNENPTELVVKNDAMDHCILQKPIEARNMINLIESILIDFPQLDDECQTFKTKFYICGTLRRMEVSNVTFDDKYFAADLDYDNCSIDGDE